jgi:serine/threonine protein kinase
MTDAGPPRVGRYELVTLLGQGGMARVYLAVSRGPGGVNKLVVLKQLRPEMASQKEVTAMFFDEARIAARLDHPNVVSTYETFREGDQSVMVMEYLEGHTLAELLTRVGRPQFPLEDHLWVLGQVLAGLHHGHSLKDHDGSPLGVVHRDVSPSNVFVTYAGDVKLLDFGLARAAGALSNTYKGKLKGKLAYAAPELFLNRPVDARTDIFAVGTMLWEAVAGRRRLAGESPGEAMEARVAGAEIGIRQECPDVDPELADIVEKATSTDPDQRWSSAAEMQEALDTFLERRERQVGRRELAALIGESFRADRTAMRQKIEQHLAGAQPEMLMEESSSPAPAPPLSQSVITELPPARSRVSLAAGVIAAAGTGALVVSLLGSPSRGTLLAGPYGGPAVHSVLLGPLRPVTRPAAAPSRPPPRSGANPALNPAPPAPPRVAIAPRPAPRPLPGEPRALVPTPRLVPATVVLDDRHSLPRPRPAAVRPAPERPAEARRGPEFGSELERPAQAGQRQLDEKDPYAP